MPIKKTKRIVKRKLNKKQKRKKLDDELRITINEVASYLPYSVVYQIINSKKDRNSSNGWIAVSYLPSDREIQFNIYEDFYNDYDYSLSEPERRHIYRAVCHEIGHCVIEEMHDLINKKFISKSQLEYTDEKIASDIGDIILKSLDKEKNA